MSVYSKMTVYDSSFCECSNWSLLSDTFYENFCPDDWDYIIVGRNQQKVEDLAYKLYISHYEVKEVLDGIWWGVTYHA
jgi:hypothetical protein